MQLICYRQGILKGYPQKMAAWMQQDVADVQPRNLSVDGQLPIDSDCLCWREKHRQRAFNMSMEKANKKWMYSLSNGSFFHINILLVLPSNPCMQGYINNITWEV